MTRIDFHVNADDPVAYACRLVRKAYLAATRVLVCCNDPERLAAFDAQLWTLTPDAFIPHVLASDPLAPETPVVLTASTESVSKPAVVVNLGPDVPAGVQRFERVIEIVGMQAEDRTSGRARFRLYREQGYPLTTHDLSGLPRG